MSGSQRGMSDALDEFVSVLNKRLTKHLDLIHKLERRVIVIEKRLDFLETEPSYKRKERDHLNDLLDSIDNEPETSGGPP